MYGLAIIIINQPPNGLPLSDPIYRLRSPGDGPEAKPREDTIKNGGNYA